MTLKWPASHLWATPLSMVGAGKNPVLGIGVGAEMGCQATGVWRGLRDIGSARKAFGGRGKIVGIVKGDGCIGIAEAAVACRRRKTTSIPLLGPQAGRYMSLVELRKNPETSCFLGTVRGCVLETGAPHTREFFVDRRIWGPRRHCRCPHTACASKGLSSPARGDWRILTTLSSPVILISPHKLGGALSHARETRSTILASTSSFEQSRRTNQKISSFVYCGASGQRKLSYLRWKKIFKVFSEDVESTGAVTSGLKRQERDHRETCVQESRAGRTEELGDTGGRTLDGLAESATRGVVPNIEFGLSGEELSDKGNRVLDVRQNCQIKGVSDAITPSDVTVICFDIETTGLHPSYHRIIEFAARDLAGGDYSTIETLVNPDREVPVESERIHKISSKMVNNPDVPRWKDVALAIVNFVESRRKSQGPVILVAHNGKRFDFPFIMKEFRDSDVPIPPYWRFADSMPLARSAMKSLGQKKPKVALMDLFNYYNLQSVGDAHRAMADVNMLSPVLQMVMNDLSMGVLELLEQSFSVEDLINKGKVPPESTIPTIEEIYDGAVIEVLETSVSSIVLETMSMDLVPQSYEAALGIQTGGKMAETLRLSTVPWDSSPEGSNSQTGNEFENLLGLSLSEGLKSTSNEHVTESEGQYIEHTEDNIRSEFFDGYHMRNNEILSSHSSGERLIVDSVVEPQVPNGKERLLKRRLELGRTNGAVELNTLGGISPRYMKAEEILQDIKSDKSGSVEEVRTVIIEDRADTIDVEKETGGDFSTSSSDKKTANSRNLIEEDESLLLTSTVDVSLLSPMMRQYVETKRQRDAKFLLLSQVGDFYEAFFEDARRLSEACNIRLTYKDGGKLLKRKIPMAGVPVQHIDKQLQTLLGKGIPVVRQEQVGDDENGSTIERQVTAVLTPGTLVDSTMLEESYNNFLVAIMPPSIDNGTWGLAFSDISTGEFHATELLGKEAFVQEILRLQPAEVLFPVGRMQQIDVDSQTPLGLPPQFCYSSRPQEEFSKAETEKKLQSHYGAVSLEVTGISSFPRAIRAAGGLLGYVQETQQMASDELPLQKLKYYSANDSMHLSDTVRKHLEMITTSRWGKTEGSFIWAVDETRTAMGRRMLQKWLLWPLLQSNKIIDRQDAVEVFVKHPGARRTLQTELALLGDLERLTGRVGWKKANARDMLAVAQSLQSLPKVAKVVEGLSSNPYIKAVLKTPIEAIEMACQVQEWLVEEPGARSSGELIKTGMDLDLDLLRKEVEEAEESISQYEKQEQARTGISSLEIGYTKPHGRFIGIRKTRMKDCNLPGDYQIIQSLKAEERFTTPVLLEYEKLRIEALKNAAEREGDLFMLLKDQMSDLLEPIQEYTKALAEVDVLCNFAEIAVRWGYCRPQVLENGREITIVKGRHPVVERCLPKGVNFVPNSTFLGFLPESKGDSLPSLADEAGKSYNEVQEGSSLIVEAPSLKEEGRNLTYPTTESSWPRPDVMILTGPNASGKSCYLRQIGLIQILAQAGSFVPAQECRLSISDGLYTRVGSVDDLAAGQSTFKVEMSESAAILEKASPKSLVLLDEVGRGTGSQEGEMIARAIIEYLAQQVGARTVFSTHYHELHDLDLELDNVSNYHLEAVETQTGDIIFDHTVRPGYALRSYAVGVARVSGMPEWICNRASELLVELTNSGGVQDKQKGFTGQKIRSEDTVERQSNDKSLAKHLLADSFDEVIESDAWVGGNGGMRTSIRNGKSSDSWFEVIKFSKRGESKRARVRTERETGDVDVSYLDQGENSAVTDPEGSLPEQAELIGKKDQDEASLFRDEGISNVDTEMEVIPDMASAKGTGNLEEDLSDVWNRVCSTLQNRPATQALTKQKGILISIARDTDVINVKMGASALFVKKFQQHEHASALEAAFTTVLNLPVKLDVSILDTHDKKQH